jgi:hypothetical protein
VKPLSSLKLRLVRTTRFRIECGLALRGRCDTENSPSRVLGGRDLRSKACDGEAGLRSLSHVASSRCWFSSDEVKQNGSTVTLSSSTSGRWSSGRAAAAW